MIVPGILVCSRFLISVCMFIVLKALLISSATVLVRAGVAPVLLCSVPVFCTRVLYPCQHHPISVICLQETHLDENDSTLNDYQLISKSRHCSKAGGLIIYIHNDFNFKHVDISSEMSDDDETKPSWESLFIEIKHKSTNSKTHIIGNIYRRPIDIVSSCNDFSAAFAEL